jgi:ABC-type branched-subunit amino acid transport system substrate-binding protein
MVALLFALGCGGKATPKATISIAAVVGRTGAVSDGSWMTSANLAVADFNSALASTNQSFRFNLLQEDSTGVPTVAVQRATNAVRAYGAKAIIGDTSADDIALNTLGYDADPSNDLNVPIVCMACTSPAINNPNATNPSDAINQATLQDAQHWNWRTVMSTELQAQVLLKLALAKKDSQGNTPVVPGDLNGDGIFYLSLYASDEAYGRGFVQAVTAAASFLKPMPPIRVVYTPVTIDPNSYNWASDVAKATQPDNIGTPDLVMGLTYPQFDAAMIKSYVDSGQTIPLLHPHTTRLAQVLLALGATLNGHEGTSHVVLDGSSGTTFANELFSATAAAPTLWDSNIYDAASLIMLATMVASRSMVDPTMVTGTQIRDALSQVNVPAGTHVGVGPSEFQKAIGLIAKGAAVNYDGASGPCDFDASGNVVDRLTHWKVANAAYVDQEHYDCVADPSCPITQ